MQCDGCTLCCKLTHIPTTNSQNGIYCSACDINVGCQIYNSRPAECKTFKCAWLQMENVHIDLRPDNCGVIFEKINDVLMLGSIDGKLEDISGLIKHQIKSFSNEGISVMMQQFNPYKFICYMVKGADKEEIIKAIKDKQ